MHSQLRELFSGQMQDPVTLHFFTQKSSFETRQQIAELPALLHIKVLVTPT
jgi:hypothetical protein